MVSSGWTDERLALRDTLRRLLSRESGSAAVRAAAGSPAGYDAALWSRLCGEIGVAGLAVPEEYGGAGATMVEAGIVLGELGRTLTPSPMLGSAVLTAQAVLASDDAGACRRLLPGIASGTTIGALAWVGADGGWDPGREACTARRSDNGWTLAGEASYVLDGDLADVLVVAARAGEEIGLFEVGPAAPGVHRAHTPAIDLTRRLATVRLADAPGRRLGGDAAPVLATLRDLACVALSAEQVGAAARCLELTVDYTRTRVQFGRPIGSFQALKHRMADLHVLVETAESASLAAVRAAAASDGSLTVPAAVAKIHCAEALCAVAGEMIQLHGGIAITWEHDAHLYLRRAHGSAALFGAPREHVTRLGRLAL